MKRKLILITILVIAVIAFAGCGKNYDDVKAQLNGNTWYYNGGSDTTLNVITFGEESASISQVTFDGNGSHEEAAGDFEYAIDDSNITLTMADGSENPIPYTLDGETFKLGSGDYFTLAEVDAGIQGAWTTGITHTSVVGRSIASQHDILFQDGNVSSQNGTSSANGDGYFYNEYAPTAYSLGNGTLESDMMHSSAWGFNIINGAPTILYYGNVCQSIDKMPNVKDYDL